MCEAKASMKKGYAIKQAVKELAQTRSQMEAESRGSPALLLVYDYDKIQLFGVIPKEVALAEIIKDEEVVIDGTTKDTNSMALVQFHRVLIVESTWEQCAGLFEGMRVGIEILQDLDATDKATSCAAPTQALWEAKEDCRAFAYGSTSFVCNGLVYKVYDYLGREIQWRRQLNVELVHALAEHLEDDKYAEEKQFYQAWHVETLMEDVTVLTYPFIGSDETMTMPTMEQFGRIVHQVYVLHGLEYVHGDVRLLNMVFGGETTAVLIDWDFGGEVGACKYPPDLGNNIARSNDAKPKGEVKKEHDLYGLATVFQRLWKTEHDVDRLMSLFEEDKMPDVKGMAESVNIGQDEITGSPTKPEDR
eukprot:TRINITY_DN571_c0_g2_i1.p1 TRINITY_DN571_c0_g2~~TRINITY_DN571_c0_g2_i1.p1  ORF type:complete len:361 (+),score=97.85 TRINITY_DN571_c0_g2_i1:844-1926(+)